MELGKESKMVGMALTVLLVFVSCGPATSQDLSPEVLADQDIQDLSPEVLADQDIQDLSPEVLADQYMVEGVDALEHGEGRRAIEAFEKIEVLEVEPPAMFPFFYGKALVEKGGAEPGDLLKGQALLKRFVINTERGSEHSNAALQLLAGLERKRQSAQWTSQLFTAVRRGQPEEVQALIDAGADVNARDNDADNAYTPLHVAAKKGHAEVAQVLIDAGAAVDATAGAQAETPLHVAARKGHAEVAQVLVDAGAAVDATAGAQAETPLHVAARKGHAEVAQVLVDAGAAVDATAGAQAETPLHVAARKGHAEVAQVLVDAGAAVDATAGAQAETPL
ncbi:MAG: ankyrin repeat domain-containing protein, partial [Nitrospira sp.]|nr:ankyrin repeat domain-containing protein [Nitrospira sp.]